LDPAISICCCWLLLLLQEVKDDKQSKPPSMLVVSECYAGKLNNEVPAELFLGAGIELQDPAWVYLNMEVALQIPEKQQKAEDTQRQGSDKQGRTTGSGQK
jgi:hypothetical protein